MAEALNENLICLLDLDGVSKVVKSYRAIISGHELMNED